MDFCADTIEELTLVMGEEFQDFIASFLQDSEQRVATIEALNSSADYPAVAAAAHSFKGSAINLGATALAQSCHDVDQAARHGDVQALHKAMVLLRQEWINARRYYQQLFQS